MASLDAFIDGHLDLQVKISYPDHHDFLLRHGLRSCALVLDVGCGNGTFVRRLAQDHPGIQFFGIDKRKPCVDASMKLSLRNFDVGLVDVFSRGPGFDFSTFDGILMRYFLLHVDHSKKVLELFKGRAKKPSKVWIIDLDWSKFECTPAHPSFDLITDLVKEFCFKKSVDSLGGQNVLPLLENLEYQNIVTEYLPFSSQSVALDDLATYLKQEVLCYWRLLGKSEETPEVQEMIRFTDQDLRTGVYQVSYGMILIAAELR